MANFFRPRKPKTQKTPPLQGGNGFIDSLAKEYHLSVSAINTKLRGVGLHPEQITEDQKDVIREVLACTVQDLSRYKNDDPAYGEFLDGILRGFDEIYVDTAPIIQMDWFLHFVSDAEPILKMRKKKLLILEKTMEELHGLKDNQEKDRDVRIRATIRPDLIRGLAKKGLVRIGDTGSTGIADDHLVKLFSRIGQNENLLLITQDRGLSERIVRLAHEMDTKPPQPIPQSFWEKLTKKEVQYAPKHTMMVAKLTEGGKLKRCYICPDCGDNYYDEIAQCDGMVPCSSCIMKRQKKQESMQTKEQVLEKREQEKKPQVVAKPTVADRVEAKQKKALSVSLLILILVLAISLILFL